MPVTFTIASHRAEPVSKPRELFETIDAFLKECAPGETHLCTEIIQSSFSPTAGVDLDSLRCERNGFVDTIVEAYNRHHHLVIRPDDVWICILGQFSLYVNAHSEELRSHFVTATAEDGQTHIEIVTSGNRYTMPFGHVAKQFANALDGVIVDKTLSSWILAEFSTTTDVDRAIYAIQMMATLTKYFSYGWSTLCGIPSVTLLGTKEDWSDLLSRIPKLATFGPEPTQWANLLTPVLTRFVESFDGSPDIDFWSRVVHRYSGGSGPTYLSGWVTAFCVWDEQGAWLGQNKVDPLVTLLDPTNSSSEHRSLSVNFPVKKGHGGHHNISLSIDRVSYPVIDISLVPRGYVDVPVHLNDQGEEFDTVVIAGHFASRSSPSSDSGEEKDTIQPAPGWFMFIKDTAKENEVERELKILGEELSQYKADNGEKTNWALLAKINELRSSLGRERTFF